MHTQDIKGIAAISKDLFASCSRDSTVVVWQRNVSGTTPRAVFTEHTKYVNCLAYMQPDASWPNGLLCSAGQETIVYQFDPLTLQIAYTLVGHSDNVCALAAGLHLLVSASWDRTVRVWRDGVCIHTLSSHSQAVWGVLLVSNDTTVVTASADNSIKIWSNGVVAKSIDGAHKDVVRSLVDIPGYGFVSCSNDAYPSHNSALSVSGPTLVHSSER